jgi:hypothetical protein
MLEPIIMMAGIIILTQLFTIYLDYVTGYSVCWKCALPIQIPFPTIPGFNPAFLNVPMFCINWFSPWGFDHFSGVMGINIQHIVALMIIAYCLWGYIDFAGNVTGRLAGSTGGPSATAMGGSMSGSMEQKALKQVGLDAQSRNQIKAGAKERLANLSKGANRAPLSSGNRHDVKSPEAGGEGGANKSGTGKSEAAKNETKPAATGTQTPPQRPQTAAPGEAAQKPSGFQATGRQRSASVGSGSDQKPSGTQDTGRQRSASVGSIPKVDGNTQKPASFQAMSRQRSASVGSIPKVDANTQKPTSFQAMSRQRSASVGAVPQSSAGNKTAATLEALSKQRSTLAGGAPKASERLDSTNKVNTGTPASTPSSTEKATGTNQGAPAERKDNTKDSQLNKDDAGKVATPASEKAPNTDQGAKVERKDNINVPKAEGNNDETNKTELPKDKKDK